MSTEHNQSKKMQQLCDDLLAVEADRKAGQEGCTIIELERCLDIIIDTEARRQIS